MHRRPTLTTFQTPVLVNAMPVLDPVRLVGNNERRTGVVFANTTAEPLEVSVDRTAAQNNGIILATGFTVHSFSFQDWGTFVQNEFWGLQINGGTVVTTQVISVTESQKDRLGRMSELLPVTYRQVVDNAGPNPQRALGENWRRVGLILCGFGANDIYMGPVDHAVQNNCMFFVNSPDMLLLTYTDIQGLIGHEWWVSGEFPGSPFSLTEIYELPGNLRSVTIEPIESEG